MAKNLAIDLGADGSFSPFCHLRSSGLRRIDHVTITHPHTDHIDDIANFDLLAPRSLLVPKHLTEQDIRDGNSPPSQDAEEKFRKYFEIRRRYNSPVVQRANVFLPENNGGVSISTFAPARSSTENLNNHSIVTTLEYSGVKLLIPGDNEATSWEELLNQSEFVSAIAGTHLLVAPHHGRHSGYHSRLFDYFRPLITLISDGRAVDTSATSRYANVTRGWMVRRRSGSTMNRMCVTTRNDGVVEVTISPGNPNGSMDVLID